MIQPPDEEVPPGPVPQAAQRERQQAVERLAPDAAAVAVLCIDLVTNLLPGRLRHLLSQIAMPARRWHKFNRQF